METKISPKGVYSVKYIDPSDRSKDWEELFENLVTTVGKNYILGTGHLTGASPVFVGLISSVGYTSAPVAGDTMASHSTWAEAGGANAPTFAARLAPTWAAVSAGAVAFSSAVSFTLTSDGTVKGAFLVLGSGASATIANTGGTLFSAGLFSADKPVSNGGTLQVSYSLTLT